MDPTAWYRVRKGHERFYEEWVSKPHPDVARAQLIDLAHAFLYCRAACGVWKSPGRVDGVDSPRHRADAVRDCVDGVGCPKFDVAQAYGFAMAEGHMDSLSKGAALFTTKK